MLDVGGDVDPSYMDATTVLAMVAWVMAELVRVFHPTTVGEAQEIVDSIVERPVPVIWQSGQVSCTSRFSFCLVRVWVLWMS